MRMSFAIAMSSNMRGFLNPTLKQSISITFPIKAFYHSLLCEVGTNVVGWVSQTAHYEHWLSRLSFSDAPNLMKHYPLPASQLSKSRKTVSILGNCGNCLTFL